jgi:hypothetical protein
VAKTKDKDRRAVLEQMRREQQRSEKRRTYLIVSAFGALALLIVGMAAYPVIRDSLTQRELDATGLAEIGASASQAGCQEVVAEPATGNADHREEGQDLTYEQAPPAAGYHYPTWAPMSRKFYSATDRPELGYLVHNLEHGYTILWYDETIADDPEKLQQVKGIANKFTGDDPTNKFIAAPWSSEDGEAFPDGTHVALTHWSMGSTNGNEAGQHGIWQYCAEPSGEAVGQFVEDYPYTDSPEPNAS